MTKPRRLAVAGLFAGLVALAGCTGESTTARTETVPRKGPQWQAAETTREVGEVDFAKTGEYAFAVKNVGDEPLTLKVVRKNCTCGEVVVPPEIRPGEEGNVTIRWTPTPGKVGPCTLAADLETNDRGKNKQTLRLEVKGHVNPLIRVWPDDASYIDFDRIAVGQHGLRDIKVYSTKLDAFDLDVRASDPALLKITTTKLAPGTLVGDLRAASGYSVVLETTDKVPAGFFRLDLILKAKPPAEPERTLTLDVYGEVANGVVSITPHEVEFRKPKATDEDHKKVRVQFFIPSDKNRVEVVKVEPSFLKLDPPRKVGSQWEFGLRIPPNNPEAAKYQADGFFEGKVVLRVPDNGKSLEVPVRV